jgi:Senescence-associated protein
VPQQRENSPSTCNTKQMTDKQRHQKQREVADSCEISLPSVSSFKIHNASWEKIEPVIVAAFPELVQDIAAADLIKGVFIAGIRGVETLKSLVALSLSTSAQADSDYNHHVFTLAKCLALPSPLPLWKGAKLTCIKALVTLRSSIGAAWQLQETVIEDTLRFITDRDYQWEYLDHSDSILLWELRAICLQQIELRRDEMIRRVTQGGNATAAFLSKSAMRVERGISDSTMIVNAGIEGAGEKLKQFIKADDKTVSETNSRVQAVTLAFSDAAKRATDTVRITSHRATTQVQEASARGIHKIASSIQEGGVGQRLIPNEYSRGIVCAAGSIGTAVVGATAVVKDAVLESTGQVAETMAAVAVDIVSHKYGSCAGQLARNSSDAVGNILRTVEHVTLLHTGKDLTRSVVSKTGKHHVKSMVDEKWKETSSSDDGSILFVNAEEDMFNDEHVAVTPKENCRNVRNAQAVGDSPSAIYIPSGVTNEQAIQLGDLLDDSETNEPLSFCEGGDGVLVVEECNMSEFDTTLTMSLSVLDSLPDQITSVDAQSDFFSDITANEPLHASLRRYRDLFQLHKGDSSIFRNVNDVYLNTTEHDAKYVYHLSAKCLMEDDSLDGTACTVDESYVTYSSIVS